MAATNRGPNRTMNYGGFHSRDIYFSTSQPRGLLMADVKIEARPNGGHVRQAGGDSGVELGRHNGRRRQWERWSAAGARSTAWRIVLRPQRRYQALRLRRTAARLRGLTAALRPQFWHPCLRRRSGSREAGQAAHGICRGSLALAAAASSAITSTCI